MSENSAEPGNDGKDRRESWERDVIERLAFAALTEQRRSRRWSIFFRMLFALIVVTILILVIAGNWSEAPLAGRYTALVDLDGVIDANSNASADNVITGLRAAFESKSTAGVILRADSPGGSPVQASYIYDEVKRLRAKYPKIPLYAVIGDVCASGCYYAVADADKIYANPASIVGSIGVLMDGFGFVDAMHKLGIQRRLLTAGSNKGMLDPFSPLDPKARQYALGMLDEIHQQFITAVKDGRGSALRNDKELFSGLFWTGADAKKLGLIDAFGSASYVARDVIGAKEIVDFTVRQNFLDRVAGRIGATMAQHIEADLFQSAPRLR